MALPSSILRQLISTKFVFILTIAKKKVQCGLGTFKASYVDLTVKAYAHTLEESIGYFFSSASGFSNVFIICIGKEFKKLSRNKLISSSRVFICVCIVYFCTADYVGRF
jgi:hypothetical protein